ncbi:outer membrane transport energization protein ExbD [Fodinibius salinus]|uniref:Outer membrane transport energization protein ExbD n=1 Tax=Fodinibius salinus TaxID=860790 RepID=A0A5D3YK54_9BACT|nr:biopolymer transporter ExbD [Fodinibius salinus]TYP93820.1 outer membrane transport energization protein ExbD [Fodinibius salinus]
MDFRKDDDSMEPLTMFSQSSLTDIVLLLLIFFLLTSSFVTNFGIKVDIPKAETGAQTQSDFITVAVTNDGEFYVNGELTSSGMLSSAIRDAKQSSPQGTMVLRADKEAIIDNAVRVMNIAKALELKIVMATEQSSR